LAQLEFDLDHLPAQEIGHRRRPPRDTARSFSSAARGGPSQARAERARQAAGADAAKAAAWRSWFTEQVREAVKALAEVTGEALADERAKLQVRTAQVDVDRDLERRSSDWTPPPSPRELN
jgi:hypothetical protein